MILYNSDEPIYGASNGKLAQTETLEFTETYLKQHYPYYYLIKDYKPIYKERKKEFDI